MCGIAGVIAWEERYRVTRETLARISAKIAHRGPDDHDLWLNHQAQITPGHPQCGLAFQRLAIVDLDPRAMQPMTDGQRWLVFNGEIYNFRELRAQLDHLCPGYPWKTTGDSEVILRAYDAWGEACVDHLNGMFAFAIWNPIEKSLFLARDRMGQKPLYFAVAPETAAIAFASELSALKPVDWIQWDVDPNNLIEYLRRGYVPQGSIYRQIDSLSPGTVATIHPGVNRRAYFDPNTPPPSISQTTRELLTQAVRRQLVADVPVGCFLSGGIDSSIIAAAMKQAAGKDQPLLTFSIGFDDPRYDETSYAAAVAKHLGTQHRQFIVRPDAAADLPKLAAVFGEPFGDSSALPTHYLARETRNYVKVALSGDGGDELFGGYDRYRATALAARLDHRPLLRALLKSPAWNLLPGQHPKSGLARAKRFSQSLRLHSGERYASYVALFDESMLEKILRSPLPANPLASQYESLLSTRDPVQAALALDRITYLPGDLLTKVDRASMLHALEVRSPFLDPDVIAFAATLNANQLIHDGPKPLLCESFAQDLPDFVFKRRKMGFAIPIGDWLRTSLRPMFNDLVFARDSFATNNLNIPYIRQLCDAHESAPADHSQRLYALLMLELWKQTCGIG